MAINHSAPVVLLACALLLAACDMSPASPTVVVPSAASAPAATAPERPPPATTQPSPVPPTAAPAVPTAAARARATSTDKPPLDMQAAWGTQLPITRIPVAIDSDHNFFSNIVTPDAKYLVGPIVDRRSDPERFKEIERQRWGMLEVATGIFTEIHRLPNAQMQVSISADAVDNEWIVWQEGSFQPDPENWALYAYHIPTRQLKQISKPPTDA